MSKAKPKVVPVMYHGERVGSFGGVRQLFKKRSGEEIYFTGIRDLFFGLVYPFNVTPDSSSMKRRPEAINPPAWQPTEKERLEYEAQKLVARQYRQSQKAAMDLRKPHERIVQAVQLLAPFYRSMNHIDQGRFMKWVANECSRPAKGKRR